MSDSSAIARGKRLKRIRQLAGLTRDELAGQAEVSKATLSYWENASLSSLSDKGAEKVIKALAKCGISCSLEWLLLGIGNPPQIKDLMYELPPQEVITLPPAQMASFSGSLPNEIDLFQAQNPNSAIVTIQHAAMSPIIEAGDTVGGIWQTPADCINHDKICIVEINQQLQVRKVRKALEAGFYDLSYISYLNDLTEPFELRNTQLLKVAPVIRVWRS